MAKQRSDAAVAEADAVPAAELQYRFGCNLRSLRKVQGLSQEQLANLSGLAQRTISKIESGKVNLTLGTMQRLATVVHHDVPSLLSPKPKPAK